MLIIFAVITLHLNHRLFPLGCMTQQITPFEEGVVVHGTHDAVYSINFYGLTLEATINGMREILSGPV